MTPRTQGCTFWPQIARQIGHSGYLDFTLRQSSTQAADVSRNLRTCAGKCLRKQFGSPFLNHWPAPGSGAASACTI